ncbi:MAG: alpha-galactosidase, partial [Victivallales bacterium]|nr:alpha-galactosidase [Victivallales bacterium]
MKKNTNSHPAPMVVLSAGDVIKLKSATSGIWEMEGLRMKIGCSTSNNIERVSSKLENIGENDILISELELLVIDESKCAELNALRFGFNMPGDPVGFHEIKSDGFSDTPTKDESIYASEDDNTCQVSANTLLCWKRSDSNEIFLMGTETFEKTEGTIELTYHKSKKHAKIVFKMILDNVRVPAGAKLELDSFIILQGVELNTLLKQWANLTAEANGAVFPKTVPTGWNDWQYYRNEKTMQDVLDSAEVIAEIRRKGYPLDFIQVDGGFCIHLSEWSRPKPEFSPGIKHLSDEINAMGLKFGLWFAPYIQNVNTAVVREHP